MEDINSAISQILSDPNSMAQIQNIMGSLGLGGQGTPAPATQTPATAQTAAPPAPSMPSIPSIPGMPGGADMMMAITKLAPILGKAKEEDDSTRLLLALKPMLSESRRSKIDEALRILQLMRIFPLLKDTGLLSSLLGGLI